MEFSIYDRDYCCCEMTQPISEDADYNSFLVILFVFISVKRLITYSTEQQAHYLYKWCAYIWLKLLRNDWRNELLLILKLLML